MTNDCERIVECLRKMQALGVSEDHYRQLHHLTPPRGRSPDTYAKAIRYFSEPKQLKGNNTRLAERLSYFVGQLEGRDDRTHSELVAAALRRVPFNER